jgi:hypothetical protein
MSDSSIALKPVIEEPSKPIPPSNASSSCSTEIEKDFNCPRMSVNQRRMKRMLFSAASALTSSAVLGRSGMAVCRLVDRMAATIGRAVGTQSNQRSAHVLSSAIAGASSRPLSVSS